MGDSQQVQEEMTDDAIEIRAWAAVNGFDVAPRGPIPAKVRDAYQSRPADSTEEVSTTSLNGEAGGAQPDDEPPEAIPERRPGTPEDSTERRAKNWFQRTRKDKPVDGGTTSRPRSARRVSTMDFWADAIEGSASLVAQTGFVPMSRAMAWSSPVAGEIIEDATKGTLVDRAVQPLARNAEKWSDLFDLIGFWGAVGLAQAQPEKAPMAIAFARKRLTNLLPKIAKNIARQRKKERDAVEAMREIMPDLAADLAAMGMDDDGDPVGGLLKMLFAPPVDTSQPQQPSPAAA